MPYSSFMENFPAGGDFRVSVNALSASGDVLCGATFPFTKTAGKALGDKAKEGEGGDTGSGGPCISIAACP